MEISLYFGFTTMSYRYMRVLVFFDLPVETSADRREYRQFRKFLIKKGFLMLQKSVYTKLALNQTAARTIESAVREHKPPVGIIQMITITEKQYVNMEYILGEKQSTVVDTDSKIIEL